MSRPATPTLPARLATGDWAVLQHADQGPLGFLGKVTDGEWDPRDDALLRARVDTTRSKPLWFAAGDLRRVEPSEEADLVELALERGLVPPDRAERLRADVAAVRERTLTFVRSPGLLDRLWAALPTDVSQRTGGLAAFFDEGRRALQQLRERNYQLIPPQAARPQGPEPAPASTPVDRVQTHEEAVVRILEALRYSELWPVRVKLLGDGPVDTSDGSSAREAVLQGLLTAAPSLPALLEALPAGTLKDLLPLLGYPDLRPGRRARATLEAQLCGILRRPSRPPAPTRHTSRARTVQPAPPSPGVPRVETRAQAVVRILDALPFEELCGVRIALAGPGWVGGTSRPAAELDALRRAWPTLPKLLSVLSGDVVQAMMPVLGYAHLRPGRDLTLTEQLCELLPAQEPTTPPPAPASSPATKARPRLPTSLAEATTRILKVVRGPQLPAVCDRLGVARPTRNDPDEARAAIVAAARPLRVLLAALPPGAMGHLCFLLGLPKLVGTEAEIAAHVLGRLEPRLEAAAHLRLLLDDVPDQARATFARDLGAVSLPESSSLDEMVAALLAADVTPLEVMDALQARELARAARRFGLADSADPIAELRALITHRPPPPPAPAPIRRPEGPSSIDRWPGEVWAIGRLLALVRARELPGLCERLGEPLSARPTDTASALLSRTRLADLIRALPEEAALLAARRLDRPSATLDHLAAQLHGASSRPGAAPGEWRDLLPDTELVLLTRILRAFDLGFRERLVAKLGLPPLAVSAVSDLARQLLARGQSVREVLDTLDDAQLATAAAACGVPTQGEPPTWLHSAILLLESPPETS